METVRDFIFLDSKITAGDDCNLEIKQNKTKQNKNQTTNQPTNKNTCSFEEKLWQTYTAY